MWLVHFHTQGIQALQVQEDLVHCNLGTPVLTFIGWHGLRPFLNNSWLQPVFLNRALQ